MIGAPKDSRLIFTILLHRNCPERFETLRQEGLERLERMCSTARALEKYREEYNLQHPPTHRYNNIAGFAEIYWDGGIRIMLQFFFLGDRRTRFGKAVSVGLVSAGLRPKLVSASQFYPLYVQGIEVSGIPNVKCPEELKRKAIIEALDKVAETAADLNFADLTQEWKVLDALNLERLFSGAPSR